MGDDLELEMQHQILKMAVTNNMYNPYGSSYDNKANIVTYHPVDYYLSFAENNYYMVANRIDDSLLNEASYKNAIKSSMASDITKMLIDKIAFTSKKSHFDMSTEVYGRVYVFNKEELIALIKNCTSQ